MTKVNRLKLRFKFDKVVSKPIEKIIESCENLKIKVEPDYKIKIAENYIRFCIGMLRREKYSPNLKITFEKMEDGNTYIKGTYGPDPILWTIFIFLHVIVGIVFLIFAIIVYSKWSLNQDFKIDLIMMSIMTFIWIVLYFFARINRKKGMEQIEELRTLYLQVIQD